jgi:amidase
LVQPAARAALYALKLTIGSSDLDGVYSVSHDFDSLGTMAKTTSDLATITGFLLKDDVRAMLPKTGFTPFLRTTFRGLRVGFVNPEEWRWPEEVQPQHARSVEMMVR